MLTPIDRLLTEYVNAHRATGSPPDPRPYLERVPEDSRAELAARIEELLLTAPRRQWDPDAFAAALNSPLMREIETAVRGGSGLWPALLPRLRNGARLKRRDLVEQLTRELEVTGREEKVARYYHEMEQGRLDEHGVSDRVLDALARILGSSLEALREAGRALGAPAAAADGPASPIYARAASPDPAYEPLSPAESAADAAEPWDEVDELFAGRRA